MNKKCSQYAFDRREILKLGSAAVAGLVVSGWRVAGFPHASTSSVSAGYAAQQPEGDVAVRLMPATALLSGDAEFLRRDARVAIRSSQRVVKESVAGSGASIDMVYPASGFSPDAYPTYHAWSVRQDRSAVHRSAPVTVRMPVDATNGLQLVCTRYEADVPPRTETLRLSVHAADTAKLRRGIYVIAHEIETAPRWSSLAITRDESGIVVRDAPFSYVVMTIDYAA